MVKVTAREEAMVKTEYFVAFCVLLGPVALGVITTGQLAATIVVLVIWLGAFGIACVGAGKEHAKRKAEAAVEAEAKAVAEEKARRMHRSGGGESGSSNPVYWVTGDYNPSLYYSRTRGMSREYLSYVQDAYGDWDTYESNRPD